MSRLADLLNLSHIPRWTIIPMERQQSVAEHSFRVAVIAWELANRMYAEDAPAHLQSTVLDTLKYALCHDGDEAWTGDIPSEFKRELKRTKGSLKDILNQFCPWRELVEPMDASYAFVSVADSLEAWDWVRKYGNGAKYPYSDGKGKHAPIKEALRERVGQEAMEYERRFQLKGFALVVNNLAREMEHDPEFR